LFVKLLRACLLVLLFVALPIRGAMAATMLCPPASGPAHAEMSAVDPDAGHDHDGPMHADPDQRHDHDHDHEHDHAQAQPGDGAHDHAHHDKCNVCTSSCSSLPLPSASAGIAEPEILTSVSFPELSAPAPTFQSDGQERPPRTI
jgi:hypothetical protein